MRSLIVIGIVGILYYIFITITGLALPCPIRAVTGLRCPGCGITTMFVRLARFDFQGAFEANPVLFVTMPLIVFEIWYSGTGRKSRWNDILLICYLIVLIAFGFIRNFL